MRSTSLKHNKQLLVKLLINPLLHYVVRVNDLREENRSFLIMRWLEEFCQYYRWRKFYQRKRRKDFICSLYELWDVSRITLLLLLQLTDDEITWLNDWMILYWMYHNVYRMLYFLTIISSIPKQCISIQYHYILMVCNEVLRSSFFCYYYMCVYKTCLFLNYTRKTV